MTGKAAYLLTQTALFRLTALALLTVTTFLVGLLTYIAKIDHELLAGMVPTVAEHEVKIGELERRLNSGGRLGPIKDDARPLDDIGGGGPISYSSALDLFRD